MSYGKGDLTNNDGFDNFIYNAPNSYQNYGQPAHADFSRLIQQIGNNIEKISQNGDCLIFEKIFICIA